MFLFGNQNDKSFTPIKQAKKLLWCMEEDRSGQNIADNIDEHVSLCWIQFLPNLMMEC